MVGDLFDDSHAYTGVYFHTNDPVGHPDGMVETPFEARDMGGTCIASSIKGVTVLAIHRAGPMMQHANSMLWGMNFHSRPRNPRALHD